MKITDLASIDPTIDRDMQDVLEGVHCPECLGEMRVGDWVCLGMCFFCYDEKMENNGQDI